MEQKHTEPPADQPPAGAAFLRNEELYRLITENTRDLISLLDARLKFLYASPSHQTLLGYPPLQLVGASCVELIHPDDREVLRNTFDEALFFREARTAEIRFRHGNGAWIGFESTASFIFDDQERVLLVSRDTSERKRAEREIRKLAAFPRFNPNPVFEFSAEGRLTYFNDAALAMAKSLKKNQPQAILPLDTPSIVKLCLASGQNRTHYETNLGGRVLSWSFFPVLANHVVHCYAEDITERLNLEAQLRQVQKMESVGQLAAGVAHDFNNILTIIQGHAGLVLSTLPLEDRIRDSVKQIATAAERATHLTRQLLAFSRKQLMQPQLLDLPEVIANVSHMLRALLGEAIALRCESAPDLPPIHADPGMLEQVLVNLAVNARDAMPQGGALQLSVGPVNVEEAYVQRRPEARPGYFVCLSVSDSGHGMDEATLRRIFEPFFTTKEIGKGTGLGLATVYGIVKQHQGWIEVASAVGQGTQFRVFLPASSKAHQLNEPGAAREVPGGHETILVVEDEQPLRELVHEILHKKGYRILEAATGPEALQVWRQHRDHIDLLLTDIMMPEGVSGPELARKILAERPELKVIFTSGYSLEVVNSGGALKDGVNFLQKPYPPDILAQMVRERLDH